MNLYLGTPGQTVRQGGANPYEYGFITEIKLDSAGKPEVQNAMQWEEPVLNWALSCPMNAPFI